MDKTTKDMPADPAQLPTKDVLRKALKLDLDAALYFLQALRSNPDLVEKLADDLHKRYTDTAPLIETFKKQNNGTD